MSKYTSLSTIIRRNAPTSKGNNMNEATNVILSNVSLFWPKLDKAVDPFGTLQYELQVRVPAKRKGELEQYGTVKKQDDGSYSLNLKKKAEKADGSPAAKVRVVDEHKEPMDSKLIGNGSTGNVILMLKDYEIKGPSGKVTKSGTSVMLTAVQVTNLVEYERKASGGFVDFDDVGSEPAAKKAPAKGKAKPAKGFEDMDDDIPF